MLATCRLLESTTRVPTLAMPTPKSFQLSTCVHPVIIASGLGADLPEQYWKRRNDPLEKKTYYVTTDYAYNVQLVAGSLREREREREGESQGGGRGMRS